MFYISESLFRGYLLRDLTFSCQCIWMWLWRCVMCVLKQQGDSWSQSQMVCLLIGCVCSLPRTVSFIFNAFCCFYLKVLKLTAGLPEAALWQWSVCRHRWRCPRRTSCCHSWRRWAAPAATRSRTPLLPSALPGWSTSDHRVSLMQEQVLRDKIRTWSCQMETYDLSFFCRWLSRQSDSEHDEESV